MSNTFYPNNLPGLTWPIKKGSQWEPSSKRKSASGRETRIGFETYPARTFEFVYDHLREIPALAQADMQALQGLFDLHGGDLDTFLYTDPDENTVTLGQFGVGDGTTTKFYLTRTWAGFGEPVGYAVPSTITINGSATGAYTLTANRLVTFSSAPAAAAVLRWSGTYAYRVRFADASMSFEKFCSIYWKGGPIKLITVKE